MARHIIAYDAGFAHLGYMAAALPDEIGGKPVPIKLGMSAAELPPKNKRDRSKGSTEWSVERIIKQVETMRQLHTEFDPVAYFVELPHGGAKSAHAAKGMAYATAYLVASLHLLCSPSVLKRFFLPKSVKKCVAGSIKASKLDVARAVIAYWPEVEDWPGFRVIRKKKDKHGKDTVEDKAVSHDATDAGAVCIAATYTDDYKGLWGYNDGAAGEYELDFE